MKKIIHLFIVSLALFALGACASNEEVSSGNEKTEINIGATAGPYSDQLKEGIAPLLEKEGYTVNVTEFSDYIQPNKALEENAVDVTVFQNAIYLEQFNEDHNMDLVASYAVPTAPIALYSDKHNSLEDIKDGMKITLPNDPTNLARSLHMLVDFGWVTIDDSVKQTTASEKDIIDNPYNLDVQPIEAAQTPRSLSDADFAFINGNFALAADLKLTDSVAIEDTPEDYLIYVTLRNGEENEPFAKALEKAYKSEAFLDYTNEHAQGYVKPPYQNELEEK